MNLRTSVTNSHHFTASHVESPPPGEYDRDYVLRKFGSDFDQSPKSDEIPLDPLSQASAPLKRKMAPASPTRSHVKIPRTATNDGECPSPQPKKASRNQPNAISGPSRPSGMSSRIDEEKTRMPGALSSGRQFSKAQKR